MSGLALPQLPVPHKELAGFVADDSETPIVEMLQPYRDYETVLRQLCAQDPSNVVLQNPELNILPLFKADSTGIHIRARDPAADSEQQKQHYIMALPDDQRRAAGSSAVVEFLKDFQHNFNVFSESSLSELDWSNVVAAGSSVVNCLLPVPEEYNTSKRNCVDYTMRNSALPVMWISFCSDYPTRHIQTVLRIYKDISEILTGFDVDCSASAYDGKQVYCSPRALESYITQVNRIDLSRRSPSYESRLSKYSRHSFEVHWPNLDRRLTDVDDLVIHAAIMRSNDARAARLVKYLIKTHPAFLEAKDSSGMSPLALATYLGRLNLADVLIAHGADQSTKDKDWNDLVHQAIAKQPSVSDFRAFLNRLDPELRKCLLKERSNLQTSDGRTPLHRFIGFHGQHSDHSLDHTIAMIRLLLETSDGKELEALDGGGDTPLHTLIRNHEHPAIIREVIQANPMLLFRENAVCRTPAELAHDMFVRACVQAPSDALDDQFHGCQQFRSMADILLHKIPQEFAQMVASEASPDMYGHRNVLGHLRLIWKIHDVVNEFASTRPGKRRLASLNKANDVALRIGEIYRGERYGWRGFKGRKSRNLSAARGPGQWKWEDEDASTDEDQANDGDFVSLPRLYLSFSAWKEPFSE